jgi:pescadillo
VPSTPGAPTVAAPAPAPSSDAEACARLFRGLTFYLAREVPREPLLLVIRSFGGAVAWEGPGSPLPADDPAITHTVMDRPAIPGTPVPGRAYIQPQWVFDSANFRVRADERKYAPGLQPPPHLSPFEEATAAQDGGYVPAYAEELAALRDAAAAAAGGGDAAAHAASFEAEAAAVGEGGGGAAVVPAPAALDPTAAAERAHAEGLAKELGLKGAAAAGAPPPSTPAAPNTDDADAVALRKALLPRKARNLYESVAKNQAAKAARGAALAARRAELEAARKRKK